jgi:two-component system sensor histidine kinase BaeS
LIRAEKSTMPTNSRSNMNILIAGIAVIALALLLLVNAMTIRDFSQPGQDLLSGQSNLRLAVAFALLTGLACALLVLIVRAGRSTGAAPGPGAMRLREQAVPKRAHVPEGAARSANMPEKSANASSGILTDAAGELRTSVDVIQEELEEILDDEVPADKEHMHVLYEETGRIKKIIAGMEQLSQAQEIARALKKEPMQVEPLLKGIIEQTRLAMTDRDVTYSLECEPELAMTGDRECLSRIIGNITDNAARFIKGSGSVTVTAGRRGKLIVFSVKDTGTGIRRAHLAHLYERFFRGAGSGIGMGLSIVRELVDACGGTIEVQTIVGKGTTFIVQMPGE